MEIIHPRDGETLCAEFLIDDQLQIFKYNKTIQSFRVLYINGEKITCID